ncbi:MAG: ferrous iron transport protein A [Candidatus Nezhaarchaeota archaeon]|nr:ferrous iron transport protein A [Candidatus Nezhaarchaeota archaeon]
MERRIVPLTALKEGEGGIIVSVATEGGKDLQGRAVAARTSLRKRLTEMGLIPGAKVAVDKSAPFHGPVVVLVKGSRLILGREVAKKVLVEVEEQGG